MHLCELQAPPSAMHVEATKIKWTLLVDFRQFFPVFWILYENLQNRFLSGIWVWVCRLPVKILYPPGTLLRSCCWWLIPHVNKNYELHFNEVIALSHLMIEGWRKLLRSRWRSRRALRSFYAPNSRWISLPHCSGAGSISAVLASSIRLSQTKWTGANG